MKASLGLILFFMSLSAQAIDAEGTAVNRYAAVVANLTNAAVDPVADQARLQRIVDAFCWRYPEECADLGASPTNAQNAAFVMQRVVAAVKAQVLTPYGRDQELQIHQAAIIASGETAAGDLD